MILVIYRIDNYYYFWMMKKVWQINYVMKMKRRGFG